MRRTSGAAMVGLVATAAVAAAFAVPTGVASADPGTPSGSQGTPATAGGPAKIEVGPDYNNGKPLPLTKSLKKLVRAQNRAQARETQDASVGDTATWLALDDTTGEIYAKDYTLRGIGDHIEVWVATDTTFPAGDCRNDLGMTDVTDDEVNSFIHEFDTNIYPKESASFSVPPSLDGSERQVDLGAGTVSADQADDIVTLVDNVRDANYYDPSTPDGQTFIAGFFYSVFDYYLGRNIMTIDANDWLHRTGANPPDDSDDPAYIACAESQGYGRGYGAPHPHDYEGTFAHEYQHLLENYKDPDEVSWVNEGLSDYAQTLVGYVDTNQPPTAEDFDSHIGCFEGYLPRSYGGAENSLTEWEDQGGPEVLCDYGATYSFMMYLYSHYGEDFMSALHLQKGNGLKGVNNALKRIKAGKTAMQTVHDWAATMAVDAAVDKSHTLVGARKKDLTSSSLKAQINWSNPQSYSSPGAPPNGSDYVRLGTAGHWLSADKIDRLTFRGAKSLAPVPVEWTVSTTPPNSTDGANCGDVPAGDGPAALYSGCGENFDRSLVRSVKVPANGGDLSFDALWSTEEGWDFAVVQVSTDGGKTWKSLSTQDTTSEHDPGAVGNIVSELPGFTGDSGTWRTETADLSKYAGKNVLLGFRYLTDPGTNLAGFWVRNIKVGGTTLPSDSLDGWKTITQVHPVAVPGWTVQLVGMAKNGATHYAKLPLDKSFRGALSGKQIRSELGRKSTTVAAIVMMNDPSEKVTEYGKYWLKAKAPQQYGNRG